VQRIWDCGCFWETHVRMNERHIIYHGRISSVSNALSVKSVDSRRAAKNKPRMHDSPSKITHLHLKVEINAI